MLNRLARHVSRNAIACIALFVALGGVSYAAIRIPANSVGNRQLKKNAVTNSKVKAHSLTARVFRRGQLPRGATGAQGAKGNTGPAGPTGPTGPAGPSNASEVFVNGPVAAPVSTPTTVATLSGLAAGSYVISAKTVAHNGTGADADSTCTLTAGDQSDQSENHVHNTPAQGQTHTMQLTQTFSNAGTAVLSCTPAVGALSYVQSKIVAIRVGAETHTAG